MDRFSSSGFSFFRRSHVKKTRGFKNGKWYCTFTPSACKDLGNSLDWLFRSGSQIIQLCILLTSISCILGSLVKYCYLQSFFPLLQCYCLNKVLLFTLIIYFNMFHTFIHSFFLICKNTEFWLECEKFQNRFNKKPDVY